MAWRFLCATLTVVACICASFAGAASMPSFPGAEGFGAVSIGGRGGRVIKVTNLDADGPGSLHAAAAAPGPRIVVFEVGGVIRGDVVIKHPRITIAGQSAPAPGITIVGRLLARPDPWERLHDIVVRFIRVRPPPTTGHEGDAVQLPDTERVMLDHLSLSWATDETIDIIQASEVTVQWSTIEESDPEGHAKGRGHNFGIISAYPGSGNVTIHHNLFAHHSRRSPSLTPYVEGKPADFRNNVVYDFHEGLTHDGHVPRAPISLVGNYYKRGPAARRITPFAFHRDGRYHLEGNFVEGFGPLDEFLAGSRAPPAWLAIERTGTLLPAPAQVAAVTTHSAEFAHREVMRLAGCFPRDRVTTRTLGEVSSGTGGWRRAAPRDPGDDWLLAGMPRGAAAPDADGDGMPDAWEDANGLDRRDGSDHARVLASGYTAIEGYLNARAELLLRTSAGESAQKIVLLGASYARNWPVQELRGWQVVNQGVDGDQTSGMLARFESVVAADTPRAVLVWGFINDIHRTPRERVETALADTRKNIAGIVRLARSLGIQPILATEVTIRRPRGLRNLIREWLGRLRGTQSYQDFVNGHVLATNAWIRTFARESGVPVLDLQPLIADQHGRRRPEFATGDGTHISPAGYEAIGAYAESALASVLVQ